ncbi:hypothetical protein A0H81_05135 [Grifola frondosa]|uniref:Uncharacterized protein n=1 Tax=Grifola frondosa TaxID=5627 RepID=A0A1C7MC64_GRIFR|nr:hypothetical protein A0H81_05135 [Grifola frondosa]
MDLSSAEVTNSTARRSFGVEENLRKTFSWVSLTNPKTEKAPAEVYRSESGRGRVTTLGSFRPELQAYRLVLWSLNGVSCHLYSLLRSRLGTRHLGWIITVIATQWTADVGSINDLDYLDVERSSRDGSRSTGMYNEPRRTNERRRLSRLAGTSSCLYRWRNKQNDTPRDRYKRATHPASWTRQCTGHMIQSRAALYLEQNLTPNAYHTPEPALNNFM